MFDPQELTPVTCSSLKTFKLCRKDYNLRFVRGLQGLEESAALYLGSVVHGALEKWHGCGDADKDAVVASILDYIDASFMEREQDERQKRDWHLALAMTTAYIKTYPSEDFEVVAVEKQFRCPIVNPDTGAASRTFYMRGKVDALVIRNGEYFLLEHKTAAAIDKSYIEKLPLDFQVTLYANYLEQFLNMQGQNAELFKDVKKISESTAIDVKDKIGEITKMVNTTMTTLQDKSKNLSESHLRQDKTYSDFLEQHEKEKGKAQERDVLLKRQSQLQEYQNILEKRKNDYLKKGIEREKFLRQLSELKDKRFKLRDEVAKKLTTQLSPTIHVSIEPFGNTDQYRDILLESMKGAGIKYANIADKIVQRIPPQEFSAIVLRADAKSLADQLEIDTDRANRIILQLKDSRIIYNIDVVELHDRPSIELKDGPDYKNAGALSTGQKCTTILPILLLESESPLFIDQPEDNLDNAFIYETIVQSISSVKDNRQLVFITHNPNIPVLGNADLVFVLSSTGRKAEIKASGTVDDVKSEVETILEGGKEAFLKRKERYGY